MGLEQGGYGLANYLVADGKHRVRASQLRGDQAIKAYVPKHLMRDLLNASHETEVLDFAVSWCEKKGFRVLGSDHDSYGIIVWFDRDGKRDNYSQWRWEQIAAKLGVNWLYK